MKALVLEEKGKLSLRDFDIPATLGPRDVRIRTHTVGICGSDVHYYTHGKIGHFVVREPMALAKILGDLAPHARREIELALSSIAAMDGNFGMPLRVVKGEASLGFITLGTIPPL